MIHDQRVRRSKRVDEEVHEATTSDGLRVHVIPRPGYQSSFAILTVDYGSVDDSILAPGDAAPRTLPSGIAHFLEHKLFEDESGDVFDQFARVGAAANAYTYYTETAYHFSTGERFGECLDLLLEFVTTPFFTEEQIEKERKVIAQEILMYEDSADLKAHLNLMRCLYHEHPIRRDIPGTIESIARIDKDLLELCHRTFYRPENLLLVVSGDQDPQEVFKRAEASAEARRARCDPGEPARSYCLPEPPGVLESRTEERMRVSIPRVLIGFKDTDGTTERPPLDKIREAGFMAELIFGRGGAFFETHCASGLIDDSFSYSFHAGRSGYAHLTLGGETPDPDGLVEAVERAVAATRKTGLAREDLDRLRNKAYGRYLRGFNSVEQVASGEADATLRGWDLLKYLDILESITLDSVHERLNALFAPERRAVSIVRPLEG